MSRVAVSLTAGVLAALAATASSPAAKPAQPSFRVTSSGAATTVQVAQRGHVVATRKLEGRFRRPVVVHGVPEGVSHQRGTLVLAGTGEKSRTVFAVLDRRDGWRPRLVLLPRAFGFDALSPDGRLLYLTEALSRPAGHYRVRVYDLAAGRLEGGSVTDKSRSPEPMAGSPVARVASHDGAWVYTLYRGGPHGPFVHALSTTRGAAACLDLRPAEPEHRRTDAYWRLELADDGSILRVVNKATGEARTVDLRGDWPRLSG